MEVAWLGEGIKIRDLPQKKGLVLVIYIVCFSIGVATHGVDFLNHGLRPYQWGPPLLEFFWTSLIVLDATVIALLLLRHYRLGLSLALLIMTLDVAANTYAHLVLQIPGFAFALLLQALFLGFVLGSIAFVWPCRRIRTSSSP